MDQETNHWQHDEKVVPCASCSLDEAKSSDANLDLSSQAVCCGSCQVCDIEHEPESRIAYVDGSSYGMHEECYHVDGQPVLRSN